MQEPQAEQDAEFEPTPEPPRSRSSLWIAAAFFLLGALVGAVGLAVWTSRSGSASKVGALDAVAMREAAREGTLDAIATLNATQGQVPERATAAPVKASFELRDANRKGSKTAKVTLVEFSDFQ
jgi:hypothetical protein